MASKRKPNWTEKEKLMLLEEYEKRKDIIRSKFSSKVSSAAKASAWEEISKAINAASSVKRDVKEIQKKLDNICANGKTEVSTKRKLQKKTGKFTEVNFLRF